MSTLDVFIARQPIFTRELEIYGYELLSRTSLGNAYDHSDPDLASKQVISSCLSVFPFDSLTQDRKAFINVTGAILKDDLLGILPREKVVIEVLETVTPELEVLTALEAMKRSGYTIALDDFLPDAGLEPFVALADIIKVDFLSTLGDERRALFERFASRGKLLLAEKVETYDDLREAEDIGYSLFQGYFFCRPEVLQRKELPGFKVNYIRFLSELSRPELNLDRIERIVKMETSLAVRLLRYLNSAKFGIKVQMTSVRQALVHLGTRPLRRWGSLVAAVSLSDDKPSELLVTTLTRARLCEALGRLEGVDSEELPCFLVGLFSTLDAMLDSPLEDALAEVAIAPEIRAAILGDASRRGRILQLVLALERGDWTELDRLASGLGVGGSTVWALYAESLRWVDGVFGGDVSQAA